MVYAVQLHQHRRLLDLLVHFLRNRINRSVFFLKFHVLQSILYTNEHIYSNIQIIFVLLSLKARYNKSVTIL